MHVKATPLSSPRLLIILNRFVIGGQAVDTLPLAFYLQQSFNVLIVYGNKEQDEIEPTFLLNSYPGLQLQNISYLKRSINPLVDVVAFFQLMAVMLRFNPSVVHTHGAKSGVLGRLAAFICRVPVIVHTFHGHLFHSYFNTWLTRLVILSERLLQKITSGCIALSPLQYNDLVNVFKVVPAAKITIIPLGFARQEYVDEEALRQHFRNKYGLEHNDVAIGIVGRLVSVKNHQMFADVATTLLHKHAGSAPAFFIIGDGELRQTLENHFIKLGIPVTNNLISVTNRVVFTSWLTNIPEIMCGLDIVALTSLNEGTPLSLIEAQAYGKPVVATNVGGVIDTMVDGSTGFVVSENDREAFVEKVELLLHDPLLRANMGVAGRQFINEHFSRQKEIERTKDFYFSLRRL